ncbi:MAG: dATP/dGTP diphosphohydrolase domain-containing protein [Phycisphaerales bacterium]|nr:hypothetical protein [Chloroflexota bacterium]
MKWPKQPEDVNCRSQLIEAVKQDTDKARWDLVPFDAMDEVAQVFTYGARKYSDRNWELGMAWGRLLAAALRHLTAWARGEDRDPESGHRHLAHAGCCVLMLLGLTMRAKGTDDRRLLASDRPAPRPAPTRVPPGGKVKT